MQEASCRLYHMQTCPYSMRARIVLSEHDVDYESIVVDPENKPAELLAVNPHGTFPTLVEDGLGLYESEVVAAYLDERYGDGELTPDDVRDRSRARLWFYRASDAGAAIYAIDQGEGDGDERQKIAKFLVDLSEEIGSRDFIIGDDFTLADVAAASFAFQASRLDLGRDEIPMNVRDWLSRLEERPSIAREVVPHL